MVSSRRSCSDASASWKIMYFILYRICIKCLESYLRFRFRALLVSGVHAVLLVFLVVPIAAANAEGRNDRAPFPCSSRITAGHGGTLPHSLKQALFPIFLCAYHSRNIMNTMELKSPSGTVFCRQFDSIFLKLQGQNGSQIIFRESLVCRVSYLSQIIWQSAKPNLGSEQNMNCSIILWDPAQYMTVLIKGVMSILTTLRQDKTIGFQAVFLNMGPWY